MTDQSTTLDLDALERAARAATPGEWTAWKAPTGEWTVRAQYRDDQDRRCTTWPAVCNAGAQDNEANAHFLAATQPSTILSLISDYCALQERVEGVQKALRGCDWYWPEDDTSSDACVSEPFEALEYASPGEVVAVSRGGVVETRYYASLPPSDDSESDDHFEVDEATKESAEAKVKAELDRRAVRTKAGEPHA